MAMALKAGNIVQFPAAPGASPKGAQYKAHPFFKKVQNAYYAARQRCNNEKHPSYAGYGAKGIKFNLKSVAELIDCAGWPPSKAHSLDRKNPHGHYEPGNVRWTNKYVQAENKKASSSGSTMSLQQLVAQSEAVAAAPLRREQALGNWNAALRGIRRGYFTADDREAFRSQNALADAFKAGWELGEPVTEEVSYFGLPSLTWPGKAIRLRGGPFHGGQDATDYDGTLVGFGFVHPSFVLPEPIAEWVHADRTDGVKFGAAWVGQVSSGILAAGGCEGWMLAIASRFRYRMENQMDASFFPALEVVAALGHLGHPGKWPETRSRVLDARMLFIPDLQVDVGAGLQLSNYEFGRIADLLAYRRAYGLRTFVGVQSPHKLPQRLRIEVCGHLRLRDLEDVHLPDWGLYEPLAGQSHSAAMKPGRYGFADMAALASK